ncbi:hypothetical protein GGX14DRAFT_362812 [Mycena pura]|uniref:Uncharacterized protein n=1 Tax=Mycena pura TaxID=153505 RepID=A0AAD6VJ79_9AGAR|nr:hypothetical protein GGX14DRAFT_362812 [Mycena pura]
MWIDPVKSYLRRHWRDFEYSDDPERDIAEACFESVSAENAPGWFRHSGYL